MVNHITAVRSSTKLSMHMHTMRTRFAFEYLVLCIPVRAQQLVKDQRAPCLRYTQDTLCTLLFELYCCTMHTSIYSNSRYA